MHPRWQKNLKDKTHAHIYQSSNTELKPEYVFRKNPPSGSSKKNIILYMRLDLGPLIDL